MAWQGVAPQPVQAGPAPGIVYGGFWIRFVAYIIDIIIIGIVGGVLGSIGLASVASILGLVYLVGMWGYMGQTVGMMAFGLRIVRNADGGKITWGNAIMRLIGWFVAAIPFALGFIWVAFDARKRGWHDMIGGTVVIKNA